MEGPTSSTNGKKRKRSPCESSNKESDEKQKTVKTDSTPVQRSLKKTKKSKHLTVLECSYEKDEKINSNQLGNDQFKEISTDPVQEKMEEDLESFKVSSQEDEDLDFCDVSSLEDEDLDLCEVSSLEGEDRDDSSQGCSQEYGECSSHMQKPN
ncbi:sperm protein associated with the nucleus on the X chromosome N4-like isoform X2 [Callithrix jacchus]|uniref:sperm protein associated with the nucleus on the X chromosome N2-like isoform X2 n=1 Tax=Callithrix jacchus TaxID=9483 RepID=UPI0001D38EE2|nr:sperm protein associated with the nucleus on the X chromosome N2-like isoform X2 [Callithrix jacchus]